MLLEALLALTMVLPRIEAAAVALPGRLPALPRPAPAAPLPPPSFSPAARAVSNWREEAGTHLAPASLAFAVRHAAAEPGFVARCVRLNNYWCIKQARWAGELGGDSEGHTGFATAADGADAAAQLLRRYERDFGRRTALAIVRRWAPAACGPDPGPARGAARVAPVSTAVAPQGIGRTLRARFLARHGRGGVARPAPGALRVQPWSARARLAGHPGRVPRAAARAPLPAPRPVADIATGLTAPGRTPPLAPDRLVAEAAALPALAALPKGSLLDLSLPAPLCAGDAARIRNYATRIAASVGLGPDDELRLFHGDGTPTDRLLPVMLAMSAVELGTLHAARPLVAAAVARLTPRVAAGTPTEPPRGARPDGLPVP